MNDIYIPLKVHGMYWLLHDSNRLNIITSAYIDIGISPLDCIFVQKFKNAFQNKNAVS
ncbi:hypothetical protein [Bartonella sp. B17]